MTDTKQPLVTAVIATYNMAQHLPKAIESVLGQTYKNIELHIVDDGSTDDTADVVKPYLENPNISYHHQVNQGQAVAKNRGVQEAKGDYVAFCDADDEWTADKLEKQMPAFNHSEKIAVVYGNLAPRDEQGNLHPPRNRDFFSGNALQELFIRNCIPFGTAIIKKTCLDDVGGFDESIRMGIDWELWLRISTKYEIHYVDAVVYHYLRWSGQMSTNYRGRFDWQKKIREKFLSQYPGIVKSSVINEGWAVEYVGRGRQIALKEKKYLLALKDYMMAIRYKPFYLHTWKAIIKLLINYDARQA